MGRKIFVSYKHGDTAVQQCSKHKYQHYFQYYPCTARCYVDELEDLLEEDDNIYKGEEADDDLSDLEEDTIKKHLSGKIWDSSLTIILVSKNMKELGKAEKEQWIPWEISFSLKETQRNDRTSRTNAMLAVAIPDRNGRYDYATTNCDNHIIWSVLYLFDIHRANMFNKKQSDVYECYCGNYVHRERYPSYIHHTRWDQFCQNIDAEVEIASEIKENKDEYNITKQL